MFSSKNLIRTISPIMYFFYLSYFNNEEEGILKIGRKRLIIKKISLQ